MVALPDFYKTVEHTGSRFLVHLVKK